MGDFKKHLAIAREKLSALKEAFDKKQLILIYFNKRFGEKIAENI